MYSENLEIFLHANNINQDAWQKSALEWEMLEEIAKDYESQINHLNDSAELFAQVIQRFEKVHSVRWRVKSTDHLLTKIVRKRCEGSKKYLTLNKENYFEKVTDLVGIRALHLFKDDCFTIDSFLRHTWHLSEKPVAYIRKGDPREKFLEAKLLVKEHNAGYRSVHYICKTRPTNRNIYTEVQIRTIFEEGWSEIDHKVRYPNFSDNQYINYFLTIFNRLAGSADEMGTFVQQLTNLVSDSNNKIIDANQARDKAFSDMHDMIKNLENFKEKDAAAKTQIAALQKQLEKVQSISTRTSNVFGLQSFVGESAQSALERAAIQSLSASNAAENAFLRLSDIDRSSLRKSLNKYSGAAPFIADPNYQKKNQFGQDEEK